MLKFHSICCGIGAVIKEWARNLSLVHEDGFLGHAGGELEGLAFNEVARVSLSGSCCEVVDAGLRNNLI